MCTLFSFLTREVVGCKQEGLVYSAKIYSCHHGSSLGLNPVNYKINKK
jgi:hypothetical protein